MGPQLCDNFLPGLRLVLRMGRRGWVQTSPAVFSCGLWQVAQYFAMVAVASAWLKGSV